jgi:hypothetical protein
MTWFGDIKFDTQFVSFVPLQIIMRSLFRSIICTFCYDIIQMLNISEPHGFPTMIVWLLWSSYVCKALFSNLELNDSVW